MNPARDLLLASLLSVLALPAFGQDPTLVIENGRVIVGDGTVLERASVVVAGERILDIGERPVQAPHARRIDASGRSVLPGMIDTHVHLLVEHMSSQPRSDMELGTFIRDRLPGRLRAFLASGITTVMSTGDFWPAIRQVRERIRSNELLGPRILTAGPVFTAPGGHPSAGPVCGPWGERKANSWCREHMAAVVDSRREARETVDRLAAEGVDLIKMVYDSLSPPAVKQLETRLVGEIVEAAHNRNLRAYAHISEIQNALRAVEFGLDGLVHLPWYSSEPNDAHRLAQLMRDDGVTASTTLLITEIVINSIAREGNDEMLEVVRREMELRQQALAVLAAADDDLIALGTDTPQMPQLPPGEAYQREIGLVAEAGLTPTQILKAATRNAAVHLGREHDLGTLEPGKLADVIVVDGNPLEDLSALRNVEVVVKGGEVVVPRHAQEAVRDSPEAAVEEALHGYFAAFKAQDREAFEPYVTEDFLLYEGGYPVEKARFVETWDPSTPIEEDHEFSDLEIDVFGDLEIEVFGHVASLSYVLKWLGDGEVRIRGRETALARKLDGQWKFVRFHSSWFPPIRYVEPTTLDDYVGTYERCAEDQDPQCFRVRVRRDDDGLYVGRADGEPWIAGLRRLELFPAGDDRFYLEVTTDNVEMPRNERGDATELAIHFSIQNETLRFERVKESPQEQR